MLKMASSFGANRCRTGKRPAPCGTSNEADADEPGVAPDHESEISRDAGHRHRGSPGIAAGDWTSGGRLFIEMRARTPQSRKPPNIKMEPRSPRTRRWLR